MTRGDPADPRSGHKKDELRLPFVDDEEAITATLKVALLRHGFLVDAYDLPIECLSDLKAKPRRYDLVMFDIRMPAMSGLDLLREFRMLDALTRVRFFTAFDIRLSEFARLFPNEHAEAPLEKGTSAEKLADALRGVLAGRLRLALRGNC